MRPFLALATLSMIAAAQNNQPYRGPIFDVLLHAAIRLAQLPNPDPRRPQATFRAGVDLIQIDVSVLGRDRRPVRGLTAADFSLLEDGQPRPIASFAAIDVPAPVLPPAAWMVDVAPDVVTNTHPTGRIVVIAIDDGALSTNGALSGIQKTRAAARAAVGALGPDDLTAIVFTEHAGTAQNFTTDRGRLLTAIEQSSLFPAPTSPDPRDPFDNMRGSCACGLCSIEALARVAEGLRSIPHQRKAILYISPGVRVETTMGEFVQLPASFSAYQDTCEARKHDATLEVFRQAQLANVTISAIDPNGLPGGSGHSYPEFLRTIAENTGGRAVVNDNEPERQVPTLLLESSSYYLLGFESANTTVRGGYHRIQVRVDGRDVDVRARGGYYEPTAKDRKAAVRAGATGTLDATIGGQLPLSDLPLQASVAPFLDGNRKAALAIALRVAQPAGASGPDGTPRAADTVDVLASVFDSQGHSFGSRRLTIRTPLSPSGAGNLQYEVLPRLPVPPGRYEVRLGARTADGRSGSVYTFVDVPAFTQAALSMSGLVLAAAPSARAAPADAYADLLPIVPTARRDFATTDRVTAFLRLYQGGSRALVPVTMTTRLVNSRNEQLSETVRTLDAAGFAGARSFDNRFDVPVRSLVAGEYLLTVDVAAAGETARRAVRFRVR
jgi:VWFA-related protein